MPKLIIHLGLAKTGTTALQLNFFPQVCGYFGKSYAQGPRLGLPVSQVSLADDLEMLFRHEAEPEALARWAGQIDFEQFPTVLLSNESFSCWRVAGPGTTSWPVQQPQIGEAPRRGGHPIVGFLADLQSVLDPEIRLMTIVTLRSPVTYLPSHAAQARQQSMSPIVRRILRRRDEFIFWSQLISDLTTLRGPSEHLTLLFEDGVSQNARAIKTFGGLKPKSGRFSYNSIAEENRRRIDTGSWQIRAPKRKPNRLGDILVVMSLRLWGSSQPPLGKVYQRVRLLRVHSCLRRKARGRGTLRLSEAERSKIQKYTRHSTQALSTLLNRDLKQLGY